MSGRVSSVAVGAPGEPYGGTLVDRLLAEEKATRLADELRESPSLDLFPDFAYDAEKLGIGAYSPLEGFMDERAFTSVVSEERLPSGLPWTIPVVLAPSGEKNDGVVRAAAEGDDIALRDPAGSIFAVLRLEQKFTLDKDSFASKVYGTSDVNHPNVADIQQRYGGTALAGRIDLLERRQWLSGWTEPTPKEMRAEFKARGWRNVVAYQCRNPPHSAHEYLQRCALEAAEVDGLLIHPVVGRLKKGDYRPEVIMQAYGAAVGKYYRKDRVMLSPLSITMRYAGPKAALFLAIVRKNYGATHYIVGRDQAGVGKYYEPYACHRIFDKHNVGIAPLRYTESFYCRSCGSMATGKTCPHPESDHLSTSQTMIREKLARGESLPIEVLRPEVAAVLAKPDVILA